MSDQIVITPDDIGWQDFLLSELREDEMWEGVPRMDGLRRLVEKHIGPIQSIESQVTIPHTAHTLLVIVTVTVTMQNGQKYMASSDANIYSVSEQFKNRLTSIADNRAKAKVFREILRIGNLTSSDELSGSNDLDEQDFITTSQKSIIHTINASLKYDLEAFVQDTYSCAIGELKHSQAGELVKLLSDWKAGRAEPPKTIKKVKK